MFVQLNFCARRFHAKLMPVKIFSIKFLSYMYVHIFVYCVTIMAAIVSTEMSCVIRGYHVYRTVDCNTGRRVRVQKRSK